MTRLPSIKMRPIISLAKLLPRMGKITYFGVGNQLAGVSEVKDVIISDIRLVN